MHTRSLNTGKYYMANFTQHLAGFIPYSWDLLCLSLLGFVCATLCGVAVAKRLQNSEANSGDDVRVVLGATLTLLGLVIGFAFSMAINGYNTRQANEATEATAIASVFARTDLLASEDANILRQTLSQYLDQRLLFYTASNNNEQLAALERASTLLKHDAWNTTVHGTLSQQNPISAFVLAGMADLLNSYERTSAGWHSQIPTAAWSLMAMLSVFCNILIGYSASTRGHRGLLLVFPLVIAISLAIINDIDIPGHGVIHISPDNLMRVANSLTHP